MAFYPCTVGGGAEVIESLAGLNEKLNDLRDNQYLFFGFSNSFKGEVKTLTNSAVSTTLSNYGGIFVFDFSKLTSFSGVNAVRGTGIRSNYIHFIQLYQSAGELFIMDSCEQNYTVNKASYKEGHILIVSASGESSSAYVSVKGT